MTNKLWLSALAATLIATVFPVLAQASDEEEYEEEEYYEEEFCGGGEETAYDIAYNSFYDGDFGDARQILVDALRSGDYYSEMRPAYLVLLGQTQVRLGESRFAVTNFRRAVAASPDDADANGARIGLAVALARHGDRTGAIDEAMGFIDARCSESGYSANHCYVANVVLASAARDDATRDKGRSEVARLRSELREWEQHAVVFYDEAFGVTGWSADASDATDATDTTGDAGASDESA